MGVIFQDDFNRTVTPPGNGWIVRQGSWGCDGARLYTSGTFTNTMIHAGVELQPDVKMSTYHDLVTPTNTNICHVLRSDDTKTIRVEVTYYWDDNAATARVDLQYWYPGGGSSVIHLGAAPVRKAGTWFQTHLMGDQLTVFIDGVQHSQRTGITTPNGGYFGISTAGRWRYYDNLTVEDAVVASMEVVPGEVPALSANNVLILTNNYGGWVAGSPGTPTFTVSDGSIINQWVDDDQTAHLIYNAPLLPSVVTISDPDAGIDAQLSVTAPLEVNFQSVLDLIGIPEPGETLVSYLKTITGGRGLVTPSVDFSHFAGVQLGVNLSNPLGTIAADFRVEAGSHESQSASIYEHVLMILAQVASMQNAVTEILTDTGAMRGEGGDTLRDVVNDIRGLGNYDIGDVMLKLDNLDVEPTIDLSSVLVAIAALRGDEVATVAAVLAAIKDLPDVRGPGLWNLTDVYQEVGRQADTVHGLLTQARTEILSVDSHLYGDTQAILSAIGRIQNNGDSSLWDAVNAILAGLGLAGSGANSVWDQINTVLSGVNALADLLKRVPQTTYLPPVWPGASNVMKREPIALDVGLTISGPVDGVIVEIAAVPAHTPHYDFNGVWSHNHVGALAFRTDEGACEPPQNFGWTKGVYVPKTMVRAGSIVVRCKAGVVGSVTPWVVQPAVS